MHDESQPLNRSLSISSYNSIVNEEKQQYRQTGIRWIVLMLAWALLFWVYFNIDLPVPIQPQIQDRLGINELEYNGLFIAYHFPAIFMAIAGGYFIDYAGLRISIVIFQVVIILGTTLFAIGINIANYPLALVGRFIFGFCGDTMLAAKTVLLWRWFGAKQIAFSLGFTVSISRLGSAAWQISEPAFNNSTGSLDVGVWVAQLLWVLGLFIILLICYIDKKADIEDDVDNILAPDSQQKVRFADLKNLGPLYWSVVGTLAITYMGIINFNNISSNFFQERFGYSSQEAGLIISIDFLIGALCSPLIGVFADRVGKRGWMILMATFAVFAAHIGFIITPDWNRWADPIIILVLVGIGLAFFAAVIWPAIPLIVPDITTGSAAGFALSFCNLGSVFGPLFVGLISDDTSWREGYGWVSVFFAWITVVGIGFAILNLLIDYNSDQKLNNSYYENKSK